MNNYEKLEEKIGYSFKDISLLITAMTHTSFANELRVNKTDSYERLEFLGDAILEYIVSEYLFLKKKEYEEGKLTKLRASLVCEFTLSQISESLGYGDYVRLSKGEEQTGGRKRKSILCDLFESVLGALYTDFFWMMWRPGHCSTMQSQRFRSSARRMAESSTMSLWRREVLNTTRFLYLMYL